MLREEGRWERHSEIQRVHNAQVGNTPIGNQSVLGFDWLEFCSQSPTIERLATPKKPCRLRGGTVVRRPPTELSYQLLTEDKEERGRGGTP